MIREIRSTTPWVSSCLFRLEIGLVPLSPKMWKFWASQYHAPAWKLLDVRVPDKRVPSPFRNHKKAGIPHENAKISHQKMERSTPWLQKPFLRGFVTGWRAFSYFFAINSYNRLKCHNYSQVYDKQDLFFGRFFLKNIEVEYPLDPKTWNPSRVHYPSLFCWSWSLYSAWSSLPAKAIFSVRNWFQKSEILVLAHEKRAFTIQEKLSDVICRLLFFQKGINLHLH